MYVRCDQIQTYLAEFVAGQLPGYKVAWVTQHLAGCPDCTEAVQRERARRRRSREEVLGPAPVAATAETPDDRFRAVQRPVPSLVRWVAAAAILLLLGGGAWLVLRRMARPAGVQSAQQRRPDTASDRAAVTPVVEAVTPAGGKRYIKVRFRGAGLRTPDGIDPWFAVFDDNWNPVDVRVAFVRMDSHSLVAEVAVDAPAKPTRLHLNVRGVDQMTPQRWHITLPEPPPSIERVNRALDGDLAHVTLLRYGMDGEWLHVEIAAGKEGSHTPLLTLRDRSGLSLPPREQKRTAYTEETITTYRYRLPDGIQSPIYLVGISQVRQYLGPWTISTGVIK